MNTSKYTISIETQVLVAAEQSLLELQSYDGGRGGGGVVLVD